MRQLRAAWRGEIEHHLTEIKDPSKDAWSFEWLITRRGSYDNTITEKISEGQLRLILVEYSLRLDRVLAAASETWDSSSVTLADELVAIEHVGVLLKEKAGLIAELKHHQKSAQPMIEYIEHLFQFTADESCGKCFPCRLGSTRGQELVAKARSGAGKIDRELMGDLLDTMEQTSLCALGGGVPLPIKNALAYFQDELREYFAD